MPLNPPQLQRLSKEDYPEAPEYFGRFLEQMSPFVADTTGGLSVLSSSLKQYETLQIRVPSTLYATFWDVAAKPKLILKNKLGRPVSSVRLARVTPATTRGVKPDYTIDQWHSVSLQNAWVNYGGADDAPAYRMDPDGKVQFRGVIKNGTAVAGTLLFTLPAAYAPSARKHLAVVSLGAFGYISVESNGQVLFQAGNNAWLALDGPVFRAASFVGLGPFGPPDWTPTPEGNVRINYIAGLSPSTTYDVTFCLE